MIKFYDTVNEVDVYLKLDKIISIEIDRYGNARIYTTNGKIYRVFKQFAEELIKKIKGEQNE